MNLSVALFILKTANILEKVCMAVKGIFNAWKENISKSNTKCLTDSNDTKVKFLSSNLKWIPYNWNKFRKELSERQGVSNVT